MVDNPSIGDVFLADSGLIAYITKGKYVGIDGQAVKLPENVIYLGRIPGKTIYNIIKNPDDISKLLHEAVDNLESLSQNSEFGNVVNLNNRTDIESRGIDYDKFSALNDRMQPLNIRRAEQLKKGANMYPAQKEMYNNWLTA